jgi:glycosyltransferase involved in cell wall biosynthesis
MRISIVTPSYNQSRFLEAAMQSVLTQRGPEVEYIVMDGGSTDGSEAIIERHAARLAYWQSERDGGQYDAITRGFARATGDVFGWLNSDDMFCEGAFAVVAETFEQFPEVQWLTTTAQVRWDAEGRIARVLHVPGYTREGFLAGEHLPSGGAFSVGWIQQESTFWRRSLWEKSGAQIGHGYGLAGDFELWARFFQHAELHAIEVPLGGFRFHGDQKTGGDRGDYMTEATRALTAHGGRRASAFAQWMRRHRFTTRAAKVVRHNRHFGKWEMKTVRV